MSHFEEDLRRALRRRPPPAGLAERILARAEREGPVRGRLRPEWLLAAAVFLLALGLFAGHRMHRYREGQRVKEQVLVGLRVAGSSLRLIQERISEPRAETRELPE